VRNAALMDDSEHDALAYMTFPAQHRTKLHSTNPLERLNKEVKRRAEPRPAPPAPLRKTTTTVRLN
jgi:transposase-like protein